MPEDKSYKYIIFFITFILIFFISGFYLKIEYASLISIIFPITFIPINLLFAYKGIYTKSKGLLYASAISTSLIFFIFINDIKTSQPYNISSNSNIFLLIMIMSFFVSFVIHQSSYLLIRFFGIRIDEKITDKIKTISCPINDVETKKNLVNFVLTQCLRFENVNKNSTSILQKYSRDENEYALITYSTEKSIENANSSNLSSISFIFFYNDHDGIKAFDNDFIDSFALLLEKLLGGKIANIPVIDKDKFNNYFSRYTPIMKSLNEYFDRSKVNWREFKRPIVYLIFL